ncbi:hypothetical protein M2352_001096 [Azospirillum fermentarium]|nr:hypothetical protein [Azospirillum fermentarium]
MTAADQRAATFREPKRGRKRPLSFWIATGRLTRMHSRNGVFGPYAYDEFLFSQKNRNGCKQSRLYIT